MKLALKAHTANGQSCNLSYFLLNLEEAAFSQLIPLGEFVKDLVKNPDFEDLHEISFWFLPSLSMFVRHDDPTVVDFSTPFADELFDQATIRTENDIQILDNNFQLPSGLSGFTDTDCDETVIAWSNDEVVIHFRANVRRSEVEIWTDGISLKQLKKLQEDTQACPSTTS